MAQKIAIVAGVRTPFTKTSTQLADLSALELGRLAVQEVIARSGIDPATLGAVIIGNLAEPPGAANLARLIALAAGVPEAVPALTVHRDCASGLQALISGAQAIATGEAELVVAGGVESLSTAPFPLSERVTDPASLALRSRTAGERLRNLLKLLPADFLARGGRWRPATAPFGSLGPGGPGERLACELAISREAQDDYALASHRRAGAAQAAGRFRDEIMTVLLPPDYQEAVDTDNGVDPGQERELLARLPPAFDPRFGTVTAGNSSQDGDGAAVLLLAGEKAVLRHGLTPLGYLGEHVFTGLDPHRPGLGALPATAQLLERTGRQLSDFGLLEMHEASAAQILACEMVCADPELARRYLQRPPLGRIDRDRLNVNGGAIAMGHPVGATGARLVLTLLLEMRRRKVELGLAALSVNGGQGAALIVERGRA